MARYDKKKEETTDAKPCHADVVNEAQLICSHYGHPENAGAWIVNTLLEAEKHDERPHRTALAGGSGHRWDYQYRNRVINCVAKFCTMKKEDRDFIKAAREDGVYWRGDGIDFFHKLYSETMDMRKVGISQYRKASMVKMRTAFESMAPQAPAVQ